MGVFIPHYLNEEKLNTIINALPKSRNKDFRLSADNIIRKNVYALPPFGNVKFDNLIDWEDNRSRSFQRLLHGFTFLGCLTDAYLATKNKDYIVKGLELINDWIEKYSINNSSNAMAYHDETTALRLQYLLRFFIVSRNVISKEKANIIKENMWETARLLADDSFHSTNTNHGMFQDIALLFFSLYFERENIDLCNFYKNTAVNRLYNYFTNIFTEDGVHKEHSPSYHMLVSLYIKRLIVWMKEIDDEISKKFEFVYKKSEEFSTYIIKPDGNFPPIGDTEGKSVLNSSYSKLYNSDTFKYSVTSGKKGKAPIETDKVFEKAGYAIFRDDWNKKEQATYVLFTAAYNGSYHKHSDDLNLLIYSNGDIITEAGPNGYNYKDPFTKYAYSSFAHNTLVVDGKGLPRTDGKTDKVFISDYKITDRWSEVTGVNNRYEKVQHKRNVRFDKQNREVLVTDTITSETEHEYKLFWHVDSEIQVRVWENFVELIKKNEKIIEIEIQSEIPLKIFTTSEQEFPNVQGWQFPEMEKKIPSTTIEVTFNGSNTVVSSIFRLNNFKFDRRWFNEEIQIYNNIHYKLIPSLDEEYKHKLIVIFAGRDKIYDSFLMQLVDNNLKGNVLIILDDFSIQSSYSLGEQEGLGLENSMMSLIQSVMFKHNILHQDVLSIGFLDTGYTAILFGLKYHFGSIAVSNLKLTSNKDLFYENNKFFKAPKKIPINQLVEQTSIRLDERLPKVNILVDETDEKYIPITNPFLNSLINKGYSVNRKFFNGKLNTELKIPILYLKDCIQVFTDTDEINNSTFAFNSPFIKKVVLEKINDKSIEVRCDAEGNNLKYAYYLYKDNKVIEKYSYGRQNVCNFKITESGIYFVRVFVKNEIGIKSIQNTNRLRL